jgi:hypothetical protein
LGDCQEQPNLPSSLLVAACQVLLHGWEWEHLLPPLLNLFKIHLVMHQPHKLLRFRSTMRKNVKKRNPEQLAIVPSAGLCVRNVKKIA